MANNVPAQYIHERPELTTITGDESIPLSTGAAASKRTTITKIKDFVLAGLSAVHNDLDGLNVGDYQHLTAAEKAFFVAAKVTTLGTGGNYATLSAAVTAGKKGKFLVLSNFTEVANVTLGANLYDIDLNSFTITLSTFNIVSVQNSYSLFSNGTLTATNSIFTNPVSDNCYYDFQNMILTAGSTMYLNGGHNINAEKTTFNFANNANAMVIDTLHIASSIYNNCNFVGGGASCTAMLAGTNGNTVNMITNCWTTGTFNVIRLLNTNNFFLKSGSVATIRMYDTINQAKIHGCIFGSTALIIENNNTVISDSKFLNITWGTFSRISIRNVEFTTTSKQYITWSNSIIESITFAGDVDISGDTNIISVMRIQTTAGAKLTLLAGADNNTISVLHTKAATVNSGANNTILIEKIV